MLRAVCDTNVVVSALLFDSGRCSWLREAWRTGRIVPIVDAATAGELIRVLEYPKFRLSPTDRDEVLSEYLPFAEIVFKDAEGPAAADERTAADPGEIVATRSRADALITGDADLLVLAGTVPFEVLTPAQALARL